MGSEKCSMGRVEAWNPHVDLPGHTNKGAWGTVCGHYYCKK